MIDPRQELRFIPIHGIPEVGVDDDLAELITAGAAASGVALEEGVLVVCQKIISKAEGQIVDLATVEPSDEAIRIAEEDEKDPRHIEVILRETARIVRRGHRVIICETHHGLVCANAGVDLSNAPGEDMAVLLPKDSDASAAKLCAALRARGHDRVAVVISDTFGRPWREGLVDMAIGSAGMKPIFDQRGNSDLAGRELVVTTSALVDQLAAGAGILMLKDSGVPAVFVKGITPEGDGGVREMLRESSEDLFR